MTTETNYLQTSLFDYCYLMRTIKNGLQLCSVLLLLSTVCPAQFVDNFEKKVSTGWQIFSGDGWATVGLIQNNGYATLQIDATKDPYNVWYAIMKRNVASFLKLNALKGADTELRIEARVRVYTTPRRVNIMVNTQKTVDYHHDLMEFELQDTAWHVISMTTKDLDAVAGDSVYVQFNVTDFGWDKYQVDVDYIKADIINIKKAGPDKGIQIPYHPLIPPTSTYSNHQPAQHDALLNSDYPVVNLNDWHVKENENVVKVLTVSANQWAILRWDLQRFKNSKAVGAGLLELTTQSVATGGNYIEAYGQQLGEEFPRVKIIEIFGGPVDWDQTQITFENFMQGKPYEEIFNTQTTYDKAVSDAPHSKNFITISQPVMQRLLNGTTKGLLIRPLGAINATFYASENQDGELVPKLHFTVNK